MHLSIKIFTGETTEKYLQNLKLRAGQITNTFDCQPESVDAATVSGDDVRVGHTFKKMIEAYEQGMQ